MPPKQATLAKFFGAPNGVNATSSKQTKLSFSTEGASKRATADRRNDASTGNEDDAKSDILKPDAEESHDAKENGILVSKRSALNAAKKRSRSSSPAGADTAKTKPTDEKKESNEIIEECEKDDDEDDEPVSKRPRRNGNKQSDSTKSVKTNAVSASERPQKEAQELPAPVQNHNLESDLESVDEAKEEAEVSSDVEDADQEDEAEQPDKAAKTREKIQTTLTTSGQDPYPDWKPGEPVPYAALCTTFSFIELTTKRLVIAAHCSLFLRQVLRLTPEDLLPTVYLMINKLAADYAGIELGIGESLIMKAIGETTGRSLQVIKQDQKEIGDLGLVAVKSRSKQPTMFKPKALTVRGIQKGFLEIATMQGNGAQGRKVDAIKKLLSAADSNGSVKVDIYNNKGGSSEAKYIVRCLEGKLRLGLAEKTVLISLAQAMVFYEMEKGGKGIVPSTEQLAKGEAMLKLVYSELPSYDVIIPAMLEHGIFNLRENCKLQPGVPLKPMLAKPTKGFTEVLDRFENQKFTCEYKYDGERAQIHYVAKDSAVQYSSGTGQAAQGVGNGIAAIFSRNSEDLSKKYPDILAKLPTWVKASTTSFVLDCETVAWDVAEKKVLPFQQLMTRKKKDVRIEDVKVKVCVFAFDLLYLNGEPVVERSLRERRELLHDAFAPAEGEFAFATHMDGKELEEIQTFLDESVKASCEGLMVKMLDGTESGYEPSKRSRNWLKIKKDYLSGIGDSLDLVVIGAYHGRGKRTSVFGAFLLACHNPATDSYESICNIGTGFSEAALEELHAQLAPLAIDRAKPFYAHAATGMHQPDVWLEARYVWEVKTADLTLSPRYKAASHEGLVSAGEGGGAARGVSLRFPRFVRVRDDKKPADATSSRQVAEMYRKQESVTKGSGPAADDDYEY